MEANGPTHKAANILLVPFLLFGSLISAAGLYMNMQSPSFLSELQYKVFGNAPAKSSNNAQNSEALRLQKIDSLIISQRNKADLREGRPFWGAASHMVDLAFKSAADEVTVYTQGARIYEFHRFGFAGNREPIIIEYANNLLACVHYAQRKQTLCSPGARSIYDSQPFPFNYEVNITQ